MGPSFLRSQPGPKLDQRRKWSARSAPRFVGLWVLAATLLGGGVSARASNLLAPPRARQGYYMALGYHFQLSKTWEDNQSWGVWPGANTSLRIGEMVTRRFGLGLQINSGTTAGQAQTVLLAGLELEGQFEVARNLALIGGVGLGVVSLTSDNGMDKSTRGTVGTGYSLGLAYDWFFTHRLTGGWSLTPTLTTRFVPGTTASAFAGLIGVQISYWTGLPRNQLDLPPGEAFKRQSD